MTTYGTDILPGMELRQPSRGRHWTTWLATLVGAGLVVSALSWFSTGRAGSGSGLLATTSTGTTAGQLNGDDRILIYKRTHPSLHPEKDCDFMINGMGFQCEVLELNLMLNTTKYCGERAQGTASAFSYHNIRDMYPPQGVVDEWVTKFNEYHGDMLGDDDQFITLSTGLFTPDVSAHFRKWQELGLPMRAESYSNPLDGDTNYCIRTFNPNTGNIVEFHGIHVDDDLKSSFVSLTDDFAIVALAPGFKSMEMHKWWQENAKTAEGDVNHGMAGLPYAIFVKVSHPSLDASAAVKWMTANAFLETGYLWTDSSDNSIGQFTIKTFSGSGYAKLMFVEFASPDENVRAYIQDVQETHAKMLGTQSGWDRFLDSHIGLVYANEYVDELAPTLVANNVRFKAHMDSWEGEPYCTRYTNIETKCGSIWTEGTSGLGIEQHSFINGAFFSGKYTASYMDFCKLDSDQDDEY